MKEFQRDLGFNRFFFSGLGPGFVETTIEVTIGRPFHWNWLKIFL